MKRFNKINRSQEENVLLKMLEDNEIEIFTMASIRELVGGEITNLQTVVEQLAKRQPPFLHRIEKGKYVKGNFRNEYVISNFLTDDGVVAYWSALNLHGMTEQFPNTVFVQTTNQKESKNVFGVDYKFVKVKYQKMVGVEIQGYGNHRFRITDKEKTIVDCFDLPKYSGGYEELIRAFAETKLDSQKLIDYCEAVNNLAVIKRLGYLADLFRKDKTSRFQKYALTKMNEKYALFDPLGTDEGSYLSKWRLRINMKEEDILRVIHNLY